MSKSTIETSLDNFISLIDAEEPAIRNKIYLQVNHYISDIRAYLSRYVWIDETSFFELKCLENLSLIEYYYNYFKDGLDIQTLGIENIGTGIEIFKEIDANKIAKFKTLKNGSGIDITENLDSNEITIEFTGELSDDDYSINYYVGGDGADDSNDGLTALTPKAHLYFLETLLASTKNIPYRGIRVYVQDDIECGSRIPLNLQYISTRDDQEAINLKLRIEGISKEVYTDINGEISIVSVNTEERYFLVSNNLTGLDLSKYFYQISSGSGADIHKYPILKNTSNRIYFSRSWSNINNTSKIRLYEPIKMNTTANKSISITGFNDLMVEIRQLDLSSGFIFTGLEKYTIQNCTIDIINDNSVINGSAGRLFGNTITLENYCYLYVTESESGGQKEFIANVIRSNDLDIPSRTGYGIYALDTNTLLLHENIFYGQAVGLSTDSNPSIVFNTDTLNVNEFNNCDVGIIGGQAFFVNFTNSVFRNNRIGFILDSASIRDYYNASAKILSSTSNSHDIAINLDSDGNIISSDTFLSLLNNTIKTNPKKNNTIAMVSSITYLPFDREIQSSSSPSTGTHTVPVYSDNHNGTITVSSIKCNLYKDTSFVNSIEVTVSGGLFSLTNNNMNYIVADYNNGTPIMYNTTDVSIINESTIIPILSIYRNNNDLHIIKWSQLSFGLANKLHQSIVKTERYRRESGLNISTSNLDVNISEGILWIGANKVGIPIFASSTDTLTLLHHVSGTWTQSTLTNLNNTQYDNGTDLISLSNNKYSVNWIYRSINDIKQVYVILGSGDYTLSESIASDIPNAPSFLNQYCILVGRCIIKKDDTTTTITQSSFSKTFGATPVRSHSDLIDRDIAGNHSKIIPLIDSTTSFQILKADGITPLLNVDSTNNIINLKNLKFDETTFYNRNGVIYRNSLPFIHDFRYGSNGTVDVFGNNLFIGREAGNFTMGSTALDQYDASFNAGIGYRTLYNNTTGRNNFAFGYQTLQNNTSGSGNVGIGNQAGYSNLTGTYNTSVGNSSNRNNTSGSYNVAIGSFALTRTTSGDNNVSVGYNAGRLFGTSNIETSNNRLLTTNQSIFIGNGARAKSDNSENEIVIGFDAIGNGNNTVTLGNDNITDTYLKGSVHLKVSNDTDIPSIDKVGTLRYRKDGNNTYCDMCMQTGDSTFEWVNIVIQSW